MPASKASRLRIPDRYFELVKKFPLVPIRDDEHLTEAETVLHQLLAEKLDSGAEAYLAVLTELIESYEEEHHEIEDASEASVLRLLMESNELTQTELSAELGGQSVVSAVLNGQRAINARQASALAKRFGVSPAAFIAGSGRIDRMGRRA